MGGECGIHAYLAGTAFFLFVVLDVALWWHAVVSRCGRINVAGLNDAVMPYFVESLAAVLSKYPATPKL